MSHARHTRNLDSRSRRQRGFALIVMMVIVVTGAAAALVSSLGTTAMNNARQKKTSVALAQARDALLGYAITYGDTHAGETHGYLPCPDMNGDAGGNPEGSSETCGTTDANTLGRLPWKTLGLPTPRDSAGECLWYAVSGTYKNNPKTTSKMNWDNTGKLKVYSADGNEISPDEIVAVIIAPGPVSVTNNPVQDRSGIHAPVCGGNYTPAAYLDNDTIHDINNSGISAGKFILPHEHRNANGSVTVSINDQFVYITRQDIWTAIQKRIAREAKQCLDDYAATSGGKYPWAVPVSTPTAFTPLIMGEYNSLFGRLPTRPNVQLVSTPSRIRTMQSRFDELWTALEVFAAEKTYSNLSDMRNKADDAEDAADDVGDYYDHTPLEDPADDLEDAAGDAKDDLRTYSSAAAIAAIQQDIVDAAYAFSNAMTKEFSQASGMANSWPASCTLFSSAQWEHWKNLVFYQVAYGYRPKNSGPSCGNCLKVEGSGHSSSGSGSYRATVTVAGKKLTTNRSTTNIGDYLEADNLLPKDDFTKPYQTHRITDASHQSVNDFVLCLDGKINCK